MRIPMIASVAAITLCGFVPAVATAAAQGQPYEVQIQANPPGEGTPTATPPDPQTAGSAVAPAMPADSSYNAGPYKGALTPPPPQAMDQVYPLCTRILQDSCINPGEAGAQSAATKAEQRRIARSRRN
jgi:hypothetical protein